jgi:hypothetical protein
MGPRPDWQKALTMADFSTGEITATLHLSAACCRGRVVLGAGREMRLPLSSLFVCLGLHSGHRAALMLMGFLL